MIDLLNDPAYLHMLINHVPVLGLVLALLVLVTGLLFRNRFAMRLGLVLVAVTAGSTLLVVRYGDAAYPAIFGELDGDGRAWLDYHVHMAETWSIVLYCNSAVAAAACFVGWVRGAALASASLVAVLVTCGGVASAVVIASAGGKISHSEFRITEPPRLESPRRLE